MFEKISVVLSPDLCQSIKNNALLRGSPGLRWALRLAADIVDRCMHPEEAAKQGPPLYLRPYLYKWWDGQHYESHQLINFFTLASRLEVEVEQIASTSIRARLKFYQNDSTEYYYLSVMFAITIGNIQMASDGIL